MEEIESKTGTSRQNVIQLLFSSGINPTRQRIEIAAILFARPQHLSAEQVLNELNREKQKASKATIYNTLGLFAEKGLIREIIVDPTKVFYDSNTTDHHHFYNIDTGTLSDINHGQMMPTSIPTPPTGTVVERIDIIYRIRNASPIQ